MATNPDAATNPDESTCSEQVFAVALMPEPFRVDAKAVDLAAAAARAALRRSTTGFRYARPSHPPVMDPFLAATEPLKQP